jgi:Fe-S-cluster containining protein
MIETSRLHPLQEAKFRFDCHRGLPCFTRCCADLDLVLTPYDILRLKNRLQLFSEAFLARYTADFTDATSGLPLVRLKMSDDETRRCPFVTPQGCTVYEDRPGACRLYPLGRAATKMDAGRRLGEQYFLVKESHCLGLKEERAWTVAAWQADQGLAEYNAMNDLFMAVSTARPPSRLRALTDSQLQMYYTAFYNLDGFRRFIFESTFLDRFEIGDDVQRRIQSDGVELLRLAGRWLKFSLFGEMSVPIKDRFRVGADAR